MAKRVAEHLVSQGLIEPQVPVPELALQIEALIMDELAVEDRLNEEVRRLIGKFESDIEKGRMDYKKVFDLTKQKLIRERNIVL